MKCWVFEQVQWGKFEGTVLIVLGITWGPQTHINICLLPQIYIAWANTTCRIWYRLCTPLTTWSLTDPSAAVIIASKAWNVYSMHATLQHMQRINQSRNIWWDKWQKGICILTKRVWEETTNNFHLILKCMYLIQASKLKLHSQLTYTVTIDHVCNMW